MHIVDNWIKCVSYAKGHFTLLLWSDDLINKDFIAKTVNFFELNKKIGFVYTKTKIFITDINKGKYVYGLSKTGIYPSTKFINMSLLHPPLAVPVSPANALFRTIDLKKNLISNIKNNQHIDFRKYGQGNDNLIFLLTLTKYTYFGYIDECLAYFRDHKESLTMATDSLLVTYRYHLAKKYFIDTMNDTKFKRKLISKYNTKLIFLYYAMRLTRRSDNFDFRSLLIKQKSTQPNILYFIYIAYLYFDYLVKNKTNKMISKFG